MVCRYFVPAPNGWVVKTFWVKIRGEGKGGHYWLGDSRYNFWKLRLPGK